MRHLLPGDLRHLWWPLGLAVALIVAAGVLGASTPTPDVLEGLIP